MVDHLVDIGILDGVFVISDRVRCFEGCIWYFRVRILEVWHDKCILVLVIVLCNCAHIHSINSASISDRDQAKQNRLYLILLNQVIVYLVF